MTGERIGDNRSPTEGVVSWKRRKKAKREAYRKVEEAIV